MTKIKCAADFARVKIAEIISLNGELIKIKSLISVFLILAVNLSCSLFYPDKYMLDQNNLEEAFALFKSKGFGKEEIKNGTDRNITN